MTTNHRPLPVEFYRRDAREVARDLLGRLLVRQIGGDRLVVRIVETEAYLGTGDRASHAWRGRPTKRTSVLFQPGGIAYVYLVYGLHDMFNVVTGSADNGSAVLVRSGEPCEGEAQMIANRGLEGSIRAGEIAGGPGRFCQALRITRELNGTALDGDDLRICEGNAVASEAVATGPRIGVDYAGDAAGWPLRFALAGNAHVSRPRPGR